MLFLKQIFLAAAICALASTAQRSSCGSLVTYRQYTVLLESAPQCFRSGCGNPPPADSMSSVCQPGSACFPLWDFLRVKWQDDYCAGCPHDLACRNSGWPILNGTAACETSPERWLFTDSGTCCFGTQEPFALADWIGQVCNASEKTAFGALLPAGAWLFGNYFSAWLWLRWPGYDDTSLGLLGLLLCSRPSIAALVCIVGLLSSRRVEPPSDAPYSTTGGPRRVRVTTGDSDGTRKALDQFLAQVALKLALSELIIQMSGIAIFWWATIVGDRKGFFRARNLTPFWRGREAMIMYGAALSHVVLCIFSLTILVLASISHAKNLERSSIRYTKTRARRILQELIDHFRDYEANPQSHPSRSIERAARLTKQWELMKLLRLGDASNHSEGFFLKSWNGVRRLFGRSPEQGPEQVPELPPPTEYQLPIFRVKWISSLVLSHPLLANMLTKSGVQLVSGPVQEPSVEIAQFRQRLQVDAEAKIREPWHDDRKPWEEITVIISIVFVIINYISQWVFWAGFVYSMGER